MSDDDFRKAMVDAGRVDDALAELDALREGEEALCPGVHTNSSKMRLLELMVAMKPAAQEAWQEHQELYGLPRPASPGLPPATEEE